MLMLRSVLCLSFIALLAYVAWACKDILFGIGFH